MRKTQFTKYEEILTRKMTQNAAARVANDTILPIVENNLNGLYEKPESDRNDVQKAIISEFESEVLARKDENQEIGYSEPELRAILDCTINLGKGGIPTWNFPVPAKVVA